MSTCLVRALVGACLAAAVASVWGFISWTVLPWHAEVTEGFQNEAFVGYVLNENGAQDGIYVLPKGFQKTESKGGVFALVQLNKGGLDGDHSTTCVVGYLIHLLSALFLLYLYHGMRAGSSFWQKVLIASLSGLIIGVVGRGMNWNWLGTPLAYTLVMMADDLITLTLIGVTQALVIHMPSRGLRRNR